jgi:hypothetical protein
VNKAEKLRCQQAIDEAVDAALDAASDVCIKIDRGEFPGGVLNNGAACAKAIWDLKPQLRQEMARRHAP